MVWLANRFVTADTIENVLYEYKYDASKSQLGDRHQLLAGYERGLPDGSCMDAEGFVWNCRVVGGACVVRINPAGEIDRILELPCSWPTSCCFGGPDLDQLFVTSARFTMDEKHFEAAPHEGGLFQASVGVQGLPTNRFGATTSSTTRC